MSQIITDLKSLLGTTKGTETGVVTGVTLTSVVVSTPQGRKEFFVPNSTLYTPGGKVKYQGDLLIGRIPSTASLPVYSV